MVYFISGRLFSILDFEMSYLLTGRIESNWSDPHLSSCSNLKLKVKNESSLHGQLNLFVTIYWPQLLRKFSFSQNDQQKVFVY